MSEYKLHHGDCLEILPTLEAQSVDAIICDPPYGLKFMGKRWDYNVPSVDIWTECLRVLKPGGHLLSFGGSRTYHRMAVNVEDAGFEIRDQIMWLYGSGFPKSMDVGKAIDKMAGAERSTLYEAHGNNRVFSEGKGKAAGVDRTPGVQLHSPPITNAAQQWDGYGTALKPAHEPIVLARNPIVGTIAANVLEYGTGALNIDACRVPIDDGATMARNNKPGDNGWKNSSGGMNSAALNGEPSGRWPANVIHDGSAEVTALFPVTTSGMMKPGQMRNESIGEGGYNGNFPDEATAAGTYGDAGTAARFFYCAKASQLERSTYGGTENNHPTVKPIELMRYLCQLVTAPGTTILDPFMGSGSTGVAALECGRKFIGIELDDHYFKVASERIEKTSNRVNGLARKAHDTVDFGLFAPA